MERAALELGLIRPQAADVEWRSCPVRRATGEHGVLTRVVDAADQGSEVAQIADRIEPIAQEKDRVSKERFWVGERTRGGPAEPRRPPDPADGA